METVRPCGCKGIRSCLVCEDEFDIRKPDFQKELKKLPSYVYCPECDKCYPGWDMDLHKDHPNHLGAPMDFPGVYIKLDFLDEEEIRGLVKALDEIPWEASQSGRRKQNFGPKCNFKKRRLRPGDFSGFPASTRFVQAKLATVDLLSTFRTVEQCTLEYEPLRGASIDPHIDDCWVWGERIVTVNVLGDSTLTMTRYGGPRTKYNLDTVPEELSKRLEALKEAEDFVVRLPMPAGSLMVLYGDARYKWEHRVLREDVTSRRVCLAYRELTTPYLNDTTEDSDAQEILRRASVFF